MSTAPTNDAIAMRRTKGILSNTGPKGNLRSIIMTSNIAMNNPSEHLVDPLPQIEIATRTDRPF